MSAKRSGLGRNLSALLGSNAHSVSTAVAPDLAQSTLPASIMQPGKYQPRGDIEQQPLQELAESIRQQGLLQPLVVRPISDDRYEIIAGERRWRACQLAGMTDIPVVIRDVDDETAMALALIENLQREDLNAMDQARAMFRLTHEFGLTHQQVAELLCKSRTAVSNFLRLLQLNESVRRMLEYGDLDMGHARALLSLEDEQQNEAAKIIVSQQLSVRESEKLVAKIKKGPAKPKKTVDLSAPYQPHISHIAKQFDTNIQLKHNQRGKGQLVIHFDNQNKLQQILDYLNQTVEKTYDTADT